MESSDRFVPKTNIASCVKSEIIEQELSFDISQEYNARTQKAIQEARNNIGISHGFSTMDELLNELNADD